MTTNALFEEARRLFSEAQSPEDFRAVLQEVQHAEAGVDPSLDLELLRAEAIKSLLRFFSNSHPEQWEVVQQEVLPRCLRVARPPQRDEWIFTDILKTWLEGLAGVAKADYRNRVVSTATAAVGGDGTQAACKILSAVGYRDEGAVAALDGLIASSDGEPGDRALRTRIALGVPLEEQDRLERELCRRIASGRWNQPLVGAARVLATPALLPVLAQSWLDHSSLAAKSQQDTFLLHHTLLILPAIADRTSVNADLQGAIWQMLLNLRPHCLKDFNFLLNMTPEFGQGCDTPAVVRTYLEHLREENPLIRHRGASRLTECVRPRQLTGWGEDVPPDVLKRLEADAGAPSGLEGQWSTIGFQTKLDGGRTLLWLGQWEAFARSALALAGEKNGFAVSEVLDMVACFSLSPLPQVVSDLIAARFGELADEGNQRLAAQVSAIHVAQSAVSLEAFEALLRYVPYHTGGVLIRLIDALADCAVGLAQIGNRDAVDGLMTIAWRGSAPVDGRNAAGAALARVARRLPAAVSAGDLSGLIQDRSLNDYARRSLLDALGYLPNRPESDAAVTFLRAIANGAEVIGPPDDEAYLGSWRQIALRSLARQGHLARDGELLGRYLGLVQGEMGWEVEDLHRTEHGAFTLGLLYTQRPAAFASAVGAVLARSAWPLVAQLLPLVLRVPSAPDPVADALAERAARAREGRIAEPELFGVLAAIAPRRLALGPWQGLTEWPPPARAALAGALRNTGSLDTEADGRRLETLNGLMGDGQYGVRRAAYRAMAAAAAPALRGLCSGWASSEDDALRRRAGEAVSWLPEGDLPDMRSRLRADRERAVREAYARCEEERRERGWAALYAAKTLRVTSAENVLAAWRFGRALEQLGDDETLESLERGRLDKHLPPSIRHWLARLTDGVRKRWEDATQKWPDPWFIQAGALEVVQGIFRAPTGSTSAFDGWLWHAPADEPMGLSSWGGWAEQCAVAGPAPEQILEVRGRRPARVLISLYSLPSGPVSFVGNGPYPEAGAGAESGATTL